MFNYVFPIFAFGLVITGIVFLGLQQAADLAKALAEQKRATELSSQPPEAIPMNSNPNPPPARPNYGVRRP